MRKILVIAAAFVAAVYGLWQLSSARSFQLFGELIQRVETDDKVVALTFDDGPGRYTDDILDILKVHQSKASFFLIGSKL